MILLCFVSLLKIEMMNKTPTLVASTNDIYSCSIADSYVREKELRGKDVGQEGVEEYLQEVGQEKGRVEEEEVNYFKSAQWYVYPMLNFILHINTH